MGHRFAHWDPFFAIHTGKMLNDNIKDENIEDRI
jgi:hypothetical protein